MGLRRARDLLFALLITLAAMTLDLIGSGILRTAGAVLLAFVLPGWALLAAWFPYSTGGPLTRVLLSFMLSLAVTAIGALILNSTMIGLQSEMWTTWLGCVVLLHIGIAFVRGGLDPVRPSARLSQAARQQRLYAYASLTVTAAFALILGVGVVSLARASAANAPSEGFTQLWLLPTKSPHRVQVGVQNNEGHPVEYRLALDGYPLTMPILITLNDGERWESTINLLPTVTEPIRAFLYRTDQPNTIYRSAVLWRTEQPEMMQTGQAQTAQLQTEP